MNKLLLFFLIWSTRQNNNNKTPHCASETNSHITCFYRRKNLTGNKIGRKERNYVDAYIFMQIHTMARRINKKEI